MKFNRFLMGVALSVIALSGCSNEEQLTLSGTADAGTPLRISVTNSGLTKVGGVVSGSQFGNDVSLGLFLTKEDGSSPYDEPYNNIQYTSSNSGQTWTATTPILLTGTKAKVYAYYPYDANYNDITAIPIDVTQNKDVMWATPYSGAYNASPTATLPMNHALSVIRFSLSKGDYSGAGSIESIKIKGACMAKTGTLNAKNGTLTPTDGGTEIDLGVTATLSSTPTNVEQLVIPTAASGNISVTIEMDDKTFEATSSAPITPTQSKAYKFGLAFSDSKLTMSTVSIGTIDEVDEGNMTPIVKTLSWSTMTSENDGVYGIDADGKPLPYDEAKSASSLKGVAIVMYGRAMQISNCQLENQLWGDHYDIEGLTNITITGADSNNQYGALPLSDGTYSSSTSATRITQSYVDWHSTPNTALADTTGWTSTMALIKEQTDDSYLGPKTMAFREGSIAGVSNQGYSDWYVPACGQLAYMFLNQNKINAILQKCNAVLIPNGVYPQYHWSSSEYDSNYAWRIDFYSGFVNSTNLDGGKKISNQYFIRFLRDL